MLIEYWRPIVGYEGFYEVSSLGRIRSLDVIIKCGYGKTRLKKGVVRKTSKNNKGYLIVNLSKNGKTKTCSVHKLVAQAFLSNPLNLSDVNHRDENKLNNSVENLEYCSHKTNLNHGTVKERISNKKSYKISQYSLSGDFISVWDNAKTIEASLGFCADSIKRACRGEYKTSHGYMWRYLPIQSQG